MGNGTDLEGQALEVEFSGDKPAPKAPQAEGGASTTVFCGNLGFRTSEETIRNFFEQCGAVAQVRIAKDPETDRAKGFCHVEFESPDDAAKAVESLNGQEIEGRACRLDLSGARGSGGRGGGRGGFSRGGRGGGFGGGDRRGGGGFGGGRGGGRGGDRGGFRGGDRRGGGGDRGGFRG